MQVGSVRFSVQFGAGIALADINGVTACFQIGDDAQIKGRAAQGGQARAVHIIKPEGCVESIAGFSEQVNCMGLQVILQRGGGVAGAGNLARHLAVGKQQGGHARDMSC